MLGSTLLQPEVPKARLGLRPENLGLPNPIANGKNKVGLEDVGKMMPIDHLQPREERRLTRSGPLAYTKVRKDAKVMTKEAEVNAAAMEVPV